MGLPWWHWGVPFRFPWIFRVMVILAGFFIKVWGFLPWFFWGWRWHAIDLIVRVIFNQNTPGVSFGPHWWGLPAMLNGVVCLNMEQNNEDLVQMIFLCIHGWFSAVKEKNPGCVSGWLFFSWTGFPTTYFSSISTLSQSNPGGWNFETGIPYIQNTNEIMACIPRRNLGPLPRFNFFELHQSRLYIYVYSSVAPL